MGILSIISIILAIVYLFFIYKIYYRKEDTLKNNIVAESIGAVLMLSVLIGSITKGITWLAILSGIIFLLDICMVVCYVVTKKTFR